MATEAKYTVAIPVNDNEGKPLGEVAKAAHHWLYYGPGPKVNGSWIEGPHTGNWRDNPSEPQEHLVTVAEDTPEMDSTVKQLAAQVGEHCKQWGIFVMKEGKNGVQTWIIRNPHYNATEDVPKPF